MFHAKVEPKNRFLTPNFGGAVEYCTKMLLMVQRRGVPIFQHIYPNTNDVPGDAQSLNVAAIRFLRVKPVYTYDTRCCET